MIVKVLFIGKKNDLAATVREMLLFNGYLVIEASDNENALALLGSESFNVILIDHALPEKRNSAILRFIREMKITSTVIVLAGLSGLEAEMRNAVKNLSAPEKYSYDHDLIAQTIQKALSAENTTTLKIEIIKARDFIKSTPAGDLDMDASVKILSQIAVAGDLLVDFAVIIDLREVHSHLSTTDIYTLATDLVRYGATFHRRTAVLTRSSKGKDQSNFFETTATNRGYNVKAFTQFEEAVNWLVRDEYQLEGPHQ